jgi:uncharacterized protein (DUF4213/DUF364 family)
MGIIEIPYTYNNQTPWKLYNHLISEIPEDVFVSDCCVGNHWCYIEAECGMGVSYTLTGGGRPVYDGIIDGLPLKSVAELSKSWNFREASIGVAALNAWYTQLEKVQALGGKIAVSAFVRFEKGEGLEKRQDNFADEVASMMK